MEHVDIIDNNNKVIGRGLKNEIYRTKRNFRSAHIWIFNNKKELGFVLRGKKAIYPLHWGSCGGHVRAGESYGQAAARELKEELGIITPLKLIAKAAYDYAPGMISFIALYKGISDKKIKVNKRELEDFVFFSAAEIKKMISQSEKFHPELLFLLKYNYFTKV